ncbi:barstar family protein [Streptomyces sp. NPDC059556]|uniref:barstar family protein n=1 Tax=Streptomyces sp. NPDC059556 TaxID=3346863 RepID=UPI0036A51162
MRRVLRRADAVPRERSLGGEAVNGPGGYFGWNLDALDDCFFGGWGAAPAFTLFWGSSAEA